MEKVLDCCGYVIENPTLYEELFSTYIYCPVCKSKSKFHDLYEDKDYLIYLDNEVSDCCGAKIKENEDEISWNDFICTNCGDSCDSIEKYVYDRLHSFVDPNQLKLF